MARLRRKYSSEAVAQRVGIARETLSQLVESGGTWASRLYWPAESSLYLDVEREAPRSTGPVSFSGGYLWSVGDV
jgi:hypothetical protein